jgi:hypothetical protein
LRVELAQPNFHGADQERTVAARLPDYGARDIPGLNI